MRAGCKGKRVQNHIIKFAAGRISIKPDAGGGDMKRRSLKTSQDLVKAGMIGSMTAAVYSGFAGGRFARFLHPWAGLALVGFSYWHHRLHTKSRKSKKA